MRPGASVRAYCVAALSFTTFVVFLSDCRVQKIRSSRPTVTVNTQTIRRVDPPRPNGTDNLNVELTLVAHPGGGCTIKCAARRKSSGAVTQALSCRLQPNASSFVPTALVARLFSFWSAVMRAFVKQ